MRTRPTLGGLLLLSVLAAACTAGGGATTAPAATSAPPAASASEPASSAPAPAADATVTVVTTPLGEVLADGKGMILYAFTKDTAGTPTCYEQCATNWPPLVVEGQPVIGEGLDAATFTLVDRTDGSKQLKAGDWPLYYFAKDTAPGQTNGQGVSDVWFVVSPDGELVK